MFLRKLSVVGAEKGGMYLVSFMDAAQTLFRLSHGGAVPAMQFLTEAARLGEALSPANFPKARADRLWEVRERFRRLTNTLRGTATCGTLSVSAVGAFVEALQRTGWLPLRDVARSGDTFGEILGQLLGIGPIPPDMVIRFGLRTCLGPPPQGPVSRKRKGQQLHPSIRELIDGGTCNAEGLLRVRRVVAGTRRSRIEVVDSSYQLLKRIGKVWSVYRAKDTTTGEVVAIKFFTSDDGELLQAFEREQMLLGSFSSPRIVRIIATGVDAVRHPFYVMEYLRGCSLHGLIAGTNGNSRRRFDLSRAMSIAVDAASGLAEVHRGGVIHRDINPRNIIITKDGRVVIIDFGIAERRSELLLGGSSSPMCGTPGFIAPENISVRGHPATGPYTRRSDIFSLGAALYKLLTGKPPFRGETSGEILLATCTDEPALPGETAPNRGISETIDRIIMKALARKPEDRYASVDEMLFDLLLAQSEI